jgi:hypothetical protein
MQIFNAQKAERKLTSQYVGVCWHKTRKKWRASISLFDRKKILGYFDDEVEAARCYNEMAKKLGRNTLNFCLTLFPYLDGSSPILSETLMLTFP